MKIAIDIGHTSGRDQGAISACGLSEHNYWSALAPVIAEELENAGHQIKIYRREDHNGSVTTECKAINSWNADLAVSLHLNSSDNTSAGGHEVIYHPNSTKGKRLASTINDSLNAIPELKDRKIRTPFAGRGNAWLTTTKCPAVIVEAAFLSNPNDVVILKTQDKQIASLVAKGIMQYIHTA